MVNTNKRFFSKIGFSYLAYAILAIVFQIIASTIIGTINYDLLTDINIITVISAICNYILPLPIFLLLMRKINTVKIEKNSISARTFLKYVAITFTLLWIGNILGLISTTAISAVISSPIANPVHELINSADFWLNLLLISLIGPIFEEVIFRKLLIDRTIRYGARVSIIISALLFGLIHGNLNQFFYAFLMGGFFAYVYIKTGKIIYTILLHISVNLIGSVVSLFVIESASAIAQNTFTPLDMSIVLIYMIFILIMFFIGILSLLTLKKAKFNGSKTQISLKQPLKTVFLNYGMVCFIIFGLIILIRQITF